MKMNSVRKCRTGMMAISILAVLVLIAPVAIAAKNDWHLAINGNSAPRGGYCPTGMDGTDSVYGTFEWDTGSNPGFGDSFEYSYDGTFWQDVNPDPSWVGNKYYLFDFDTSWPPWRQIGSNFEIMSDYPGTMDYYCLTP